MSRPELTLTQITLPFKHRLPLRMTVGTLVSVRGTIFPHTEKFEINFFNEKGDAYVHINPRFSENVIVRNSKLNGKWGEEERSRSIGPLCSSPTFEMMILFNQQSCSIASNGVHLFKYFYRMPMDEIEGIGIIGDIDVHSVIVQPNSIQFSANYIRPIEIRNPRSPFITPLTRCESGLAVTISGKPLQNADFFNVNFENETVIFFHISCRLKEKAVVRNSKGSNFKWHSEERSLSYFPFKEGLSFDMYITVAEGEYLVAINSEFFFRFKHRILPLGLISQFSIKGDIDIHSVKFDYN